MISSAFRVAIRKMQRRLAVASGQRIAVFVDGDGITAHYAERVLQSLAQTHQITTIRVFGNITPRNISSWSKMIKRHGIVMRQLPSLVEGKNAADIALALDALELHLNRPMPSYAVLTNDVDFTPLVLRLKEDGAYVAGFGHKWTPTNFRRVCTSFTEINQIEQEKDA